MLLYYIAFQSQITLTLGDLRDTGNFRMKCSFAVYSLLVAIIPICSGSNYVPFVFWTNIRSEVCQPDISVYPAEYISKFSGSDYFKCLQKASPKLIKLFITDELDESDFSLNREEGGPKKAFTHLQTTLSTTASVMMPAVQQTSVSAFLERTLKSSFENADESVTELPTADRSTLASTRATLAIIDETIQEELLKLPVGVKYVAILTSVNAPKKIPHIMDENYFGRQLLSVDDEPVGENFTTLIKYQDCIYLAYNNITLTYKKEVWNLTNPDVVNGSCSDNVNITSMLVKFQAFNNKTEKTFKLAFTFERKVSAVSAITWWNISSIVLSHNLNATNGTTDQNYNLKIGDHYSYSAPDKWSWVCAAPDAMTWSDRKKDNPTIQKLQFQFIQMQPFSISNESFSRALDCSGFLTGPIWTGTVVSILLLIIFAFGMAGIAAITTMDRFDDPRGKTINVPTHESK